MKEFFAAILPIGRSGRLTYAIVFLGSLVVLGSWFVALLYVPVQSTWLLRPDRLFELLKLSSSPSRPEMVQLGVLVLLLWLNFNVTINRLGSMGQSRLWALAVLVPVLLPFICIPLMVLQGDEADNRHTLQEPQSEGFLSLFSLVGRASRIRFWKVFGVVTVLSLVILTPVILLNLMEKGLLFAVPVLGIWTLLGYVMMATTMQRLCDLGQTGQVMLLMSLPPMFLLLILPLGFFPSIVSSPEAAAPSGRRRRSAKNTRRSSPAAADDPPDAVIPAHPDAAAAAPPKATKRSWRRRGRDLADRKRAMYDDSEFDLGLDTLRPTPQQAVMRDDPDERGVPSAVREMPRQQS